MFELVIAFVLFFGMLIAPALSSNSITGDRANGTLAILQNTLLTPGQLLIGKWLAAWVASLGFLVVTIPLIGWAMTYGDVYLPGVPVLLGMLALELAIVCAIGVGVSAVANRTLFAVLISYLLVAMLGLGTLIAYGLSMELVKTEVMVSEQIWPDEYMNGDGTARVGPEQLHLRDGALPANDLRHRAQHLAAGGQPVCGGGRRGAAPGAGPEQPVLRHDGTDGRNQRGRAHVAGRAAEFHPVHQRGQESRTGARERDAVVAAGPGPAAAVGRRPAGGRAAQAAYPCREAGVGNPHRLTSIFL